MLFSNRVCDMCKCSSKFPAVYCKKCDMNLCSDFECKTRSENIICLAKISILPEVTSNVTTHSKPSLASYGFV